MTETAGIDYRVCTADVKALADTTYTFAWCNVGNVPADVPRFDVRAPRVAQLLGGTAVGADVLGVSELRDMPDLTILEFVAQVSRASGGRYGFESGRVSAVPERQFALGLFYDRTKFWVETTQTVMMEAGVPGGRMPLTTHPDPGQFGKSVMARHVFAVRLAPVYDGRIHATARFWVALAHLNIDREDNMRQCEWLNARLPALCRGEPYMLMMDTNWFRDRDGGACRAKVAEMHAVHVFNNATEASTGRRMNTTFSGFPNDAFRSRDIYALEEVAGGARVSDLDTIVTDLAHADWRVTDPQIVTEGPEDAPMDKSDYHGFATDHFPIRVRVCLPPSCADCKPLYG